jgi:hypothetical protein
MYKVPEADEITYLLGPDGSHLRAVQVGNLHLRLIFRYNRCMYRHMQQHSVKLRSAFPHSRVASAGAARVQGPRGF